MGRKWAVATFVLAFAVLVSGCAWAGDDEYAGYAAGFKNFVTCELTRTDAVDHFKGKPFTVTMVNLHGLQKESDMTILTGAVQCFVTDGYQTLYAAIGVETVAGRTKVGYYTIRKKNFSILASELFRFPYEERCPWARYWINLN